MAHSSPLHIRLMGLVVWNLKHIQTQTKMLKQNIMLVDVEQNHFYEYFIF